MTEENWRKLLERTMQILLNTVFLNRELEKTWDDDGYLFATPPTAESAQAIERPRPFRTGNWAAKAIVVSPTFLRILFLIGSQTIHPNWSRLACMDLTNGILIYLNWLDVEIIKLKADDREWIVRVKGQVLAREEELYSILTQQPLHDCSCLCQQALVCEDIQHSLWFPQVAQDQCDDRTKV